jgi:hypothetical protein
MRAYSPDLRLRILADRDRGRTTRAVATKYDVSASWGRRLKQRRRQTGDIAPRPQTQLGRLRRPTPRGHPPNAGRHTERTTPAAATDRRPLHLVAGRRRPGPEREKKVSRAAEQDRPDVALQRHRLRLGNLDT